MCALPILPGTRVPDLRRHAVILFSRPSRSRGYRTDCYFWSLYWPRDCDEFRAVGKCGLDLNLAKHLGNTLHDIVAGEHVSARFHQIGNRVATARALQKERRNKGGGFR